MERLGFAGNKATFQKLLSHYSQKQRSYHNTHHIQSVLEHLEQAQHLADDADAIELALWFHDAIYKIFSSTNERDSADWAVAFIRDNNGGDGLAKKVHALIMATLHNGKPVGHDEQLMVDIDLSVLGCAPKMYAQFELWIRQEYRLIPRPIYNKKRKAILQGFLDRECIYAHPYFYEKLEGNARVNLSTAIVSL